MVRLFTLVSRVNYYTLKTWNNVPRRRQTVSSINWQLFLLEKVINVSWNIFVRLSYCVEGQWDQGIWERQMLSIITKTTRSLYCYNIRRLYWNNNIWVPQHIIYRTTFAYHNTTIIELHLRTIKRQLSNYI